MAMMIALVVVMVLALISVALTNLALSEYSAAAALDRSTQAFLAAEAGAEWAIALLRNDADWSDNVTTYQDVPFPDPASGAAPTGRFTVSLRPTAQDPGANIMVRSTGTVRGATRAVEFVLHRLSGADFVTYSVLTVDITRISGGGSLQIHGSAYFEGDLILRGGAQAGIFNDRYVSLSDAPNFLNHLYVRGNLDLTQGNPTIGTPYYWVHVAGNIIGGGNNFTPSNLDGTVPPPFYPNVIEETRRALVDRGNLLDLDLGGGTARMVRCRRQGGAWVTEYVNDLDLTGTTEPATFFLPLRTANPPCPPAAVTVSQVRSGGQYMLMWDAQDPLVPLVLRNDAQPVYVPGQVRVGRDIRYEGRGTVVIASQPGATTPSQLTPQSLCALDLNGNGLCNGSTSAGRTIRARVSPCQGTPGVDNPQSTYARVNPSYPNSPDLLMFLVNGSAYTDVNANACAQEMNVVAVIGDRNAPPLSPAPASGCPGAHVLIRRKLQWYGILMTREMCLGQVPDFWQMPDLTTYLPGWARRIFLNPTGPVQVRNWQERFSF